MPLGGDLWINAAQLRNMSLAGWHCTSLNQTRRSCNVYRAVCRLSHHGRMEFSSFHGPYGRNRQLQQLSQRRAGYRQDAYAHSVQRAVRRLPQHVGLDTGRL